MTALPPERTDTFRSTPHRFILPSRKQALWFWIRIRLLTMRRLLQDAFSPHVRRWSSVPSVQSSLSQAPVIAEHRSPLWNDGRSDEFILIAGKVHNLRCAIFAFDGVELPAGAMLSFWQQLGRISARKGFVLGREIREGCVVPTLGGGICQLSNALATVAVKAGLLLVERHGHTAPIESASQTGEYVDATVLWKHIDLRIVTDRALRLEVQMDESSITLRLRATVKSQQFPQFQIHIHTRKHAASAVPVARNCLTCHEVSCFRHQPELQGESRQLGSNVTLVDGLTPELTGYLKQHRELLEQFYLPRAITAGQRQRVGLAPASWKIQGNRFSGLIVSLRRALWQRWNAQSAGARQASVMSGQHWQARYALNQLPVTATSLLVDQAYLPELWRSGQLAGRHLRVWMPHLPMQAIIEQLDAAARRWPDEPSLRDFRPAAELVQAESLALHHARQIITSHHAVAQWARRHIKAEITLLEYSKKQGAVWETKARGAMKTLVFPASTLARKGWRELCAALAHLPIQPIQLVILGSVFDTSYLPAHVQWRCMNYSDHWVDQAHAVVFPAYVEHTPHALNFALSCGIPVIATPACGLPLHPRLTLVNAGDISALAEAMCQL